MPILMVEVLVGEQVTFDAMAVAIGAMDTICINKDTKMVNKLNNILV